MNGTENTINEESKKTSTQEYIHAYIPAHNMRL